MSKNNGNNPIGCIDAGAWCFPRQWAVVALTGEYERARIGHDNALQLIKKVLVHTERVVVGNILWLTTPKSTHDKHQRRVAKCKSKQK